jgi:hypothetical protein
VKATEERTSAIDKMSLNPFIEKNDFQTKRYLKNGTRKRVRFELLSTIVFVLASPKTGKNWPYFRNTN